MDLQPLRPYPGAVRDARAAACLLQGDVQEVRVPVSGKEEETMKIENQLIATDLEIVKKDLLRMRGELGSGLGDLGRIRLKQVSAALLKIDKGSYGICEACAHSIPRARLIDKPYVRYCVSCF